MKALFFILLASCARDPYLIALTACVESNPTRATIDACRASAAQRFYPQDAGKDGPHE